LELLIILAAVVGLYMAWNIGANDVAVGNCRRQSASIPLRSSSIRNFAYIIKQLIREILIQTMIAVNKFK